MLQNRRPPECDIDIHENLVAAERLDEPIVQPTSRAS
jgi:hypothetical protein